MNILIGLGIAMCSIGILLIGVSLFLIRRTYQHHMKQQRKPVQHSYRNVAKILLDEHRAMRYRGKR